LGCLVSTKGIKASSDKIRAIVQMQPPQTRKEVQMLICHIEALNRFIAKLAERSLPLFSILWGSAKVEWGTKQQEAFDDLKRYLEHLIVEKETTYKDKTMKQQFPVYSISEAHKI
jgi:hypothetical protein